MLEDVVDGGDIVVVQAGDCARFPVQSLVRFSAWRLGEGFERDAAFEALVIREVDGTHGTRTERALESCRGRAWRPA